VERTRPWTPASTSESGRIGHGDARNDPLPLARRPPPLVLRSGHGPQRPVDGRARQRDPRRAHGGRGPRLRGHQQRAPARRRGGRRPRGGDGFFRRGRRVPLAGDPPQARRGPEPGLASPGGLLDSRGRGGPPLLRVEPRRGRGPRRTPGRGGLGGGSAEGARRRAPLHERLLAARGGRPGLRGHRQRSGAGRQGGRGAELRRPRPGDRAGALERWRTGRGARRRPVGEPRVRHARGPAPGRLPGRRRPPLRLRAGHGQAPLVVRREPALRARRRSSPCCPDRLPGDPRWPRLHRPRARSADFGPAGAPVGPGRPVCRRRPLRGGVGLEPGRRQILDHAFAGRGRGRHRLCRRFRRPPAGDRRGDGAGALDLRHLRRGLGLAAPRRRQGLSRRRGRRPRRAARRPEAGGPRRGESRRIDLDNPRRRGRRPLRGDQLAAVRVGGGQRAISLFGLWLSLS
jgi:hypothetical protein